MQRQSKSQLSRWSKHARSSVEKELRRQQTVAGRKINKIIYTSGCRSNGLHVARRGDVRAGVESVDNEFVRRESLQTGQSHRVGAAGN